MDDSLHIYQRLLSELMYRLEVRSAMVTVDIRRSAQCFLVMFFVPPLGMCKRMKINNLHVVARPFYRIDNLDGVSPPPFPREWIAGPGKASQRGRATPRFPDRWILSTLHMYGSPAFVHSRVALRICSLGSSDLRPSRTSVSHYILTLGSPSFPQLPLPLFSLTHLLLARSEPRTRRSCYPV